MITFEEIDNRLARIGKNRAWLADVTPYSADYIRTVLAPNSTRRTDRVLAIISKAIEDEEASQSTDIEKFKSQTLIVEATREEFRKWNQAALDKGMLIEDWAVQGLNRLAETLEQGNDKVNAA